MVHCLSQTSRASFEPTLTLGQTRECEELQETVTSLKQQLSDASELRKFSPVVGYLQIFNGINNSLGELGVEKGKAFLTNKNESSFVLAQVSPWTLFVL